MQLLPPEGQTSILEIFTLCCSGSRNGNKVKCLRVFWYLNFQKGSPFLEALNQFVDTVFEVGISSDTQFYNHIPNATKCLTWEGVEASHTKEGHEVIVNLDDTCGSIILLASGLGGALVIFTLELLTKAKKFRWKKTQPTLMKWLP